MLSNAELANCKNTHTVMSLLQAYTLTGPHHGLIIGLSLVGMTNFIVKILWKQHKK